MFPEQLRIGNYTPNEKVPLARLGIKENWIVGLLRKSLFFAFI